MDPSWRTSFVAGARLGAICGALGTFEILAANARTINLSSGILIAVAWLALGMLAGGGAGVLGGRGFVILRWRRSDGALFLGTVLAGHLLLPPGYGLAGGAALWLLRLVRRRFGQRFARLDGLVILVLAGVGLEGLTAVSPPRAPALEPSAPLVPGSPLPGSLSVTISLHPAADFPAVPAVHLPLQTLNASLPGRLAALWSGRAPARTRVGTHGPRSLPGGGALTHAPQRPGVSALLALLANRNEGRPDPDALTGSLTALADAAGIPVLRTHPSPSDPPLSLRILEGPAAPERELAEELRRGGAWIDVTLGPQADAEIALSGRGFALVPARGRVTLMDVTPTALHLLGLAVPRDCDGRVLLEYLDGDGPAGRAPRYLNLRAGSARTPPANQRRSKRS